MEEVNSQNNQSIQKTVESLSPNERKILSYLEEEISRIIEKTNLDRVSVLRALEYLSNKKILALKHKSKKIVQLGVNGLLYKQKGLPERRLINLIEQKKIISLEEAQKQSRLSPNEFKAALGALKKKALIKIMNGKLSLEAKKDEITKKSLEEQLVSVLPRDYDELQPEQLHAFNALKNRKEIVEIQEETQTIIELTEFGKKIISQDLSKTEDMIESLTPQLLKSGKWKAKKFRRYDITSGVPKIWGGKRHFVNQAIDYARRVWSELGFKEMNGNLIVSSFWNFDALFTAQDHPVREMQDTFYIKDVKIELPDKKLVEQIKKTHESGTQGSKGWGYEWKEQDAEKVLLRTHTTCLSAQTLYRLSKLPEEKRRGKFFAIGKCFRNETVDWSHGFEFYQTEGIVVGKNLNLRHLLGYLTEFYKKMGFEKIRFAPAYFPYTEPSVEVSVWHPEKQVWLELGGSGIFRPEVTEPLLGKGYQVLAWGQGFDRIITDFYKIKDLREMYENNITKLREKKIWVR